MAQTPGVQVLVKGLTILKRIASSVTPPTLTEIAIDLAMSPSTVYRMLQTLETEGWITRLEGRRYVLGPSSYLLLRGTKGEPPEMQLARQLIREAAEYAGEVASISVLSLPHIIFIAREEGSQPSVVQVQSHVGTLAPAERVASGVALLACVLQVEPQKVPLTLLQGPAGKRIRDAQRVGYAICLGAWSPEVNSVGVALVNAAEHPVCGVEVAAPRERFPVEKAHELGQWMLGRCRELSLGRAKTSLN